jgi:hypothetical protein
MISSTASIRSCNTLRYREQEEKLEEVNLLHIHERLSDPRTQQSRAKLCGSLIQDPNQRSFVCKVRFILIDLSVIRDLSFRHLHRIRQRTSW